MSTESKSQQVYLGYANRWRWQTVSGNRFHDKEKSEHNDFIKNFDIESDSKTDYELMIDRQARPVTVLINRNAESILDLSEEQFASYIARLDELQATVIQLSASCSMRSSKFHLKAWTDPSTFESVLKDLGKIDKDVELDNEALQALQSAYDRDVTENLASEPAIAFDGSDLFGGNEPTIGTVDELSDPLHALVIADVSSLYKTICWLESSESGFQKMSADLQCDCGYTIQRLDHESTTLAYYNLHLDMWKKASS